ncbi:VIR protein [Plasmodium vivax]|uniref:VIR protein n=1 Tax=Plasmodium vivax TaxID=5855 RepID=A0A1G4E3W8_PLAVI|nr:VIR protein [Plasmodium vivax]
MLKSLTEDPFYAYVKWFPVIENLISKKNADAVSSDKTDCDSFKTNKLLENEANAGSFPDRCSKISKYSTDHIGSSNSPKPAFCYYINYWFHGELKDSVKSSYSTLLIDFYKQIRSLKAFDTYKSEISKDKYEELKFLYELYDAFKTFKEVSSKENQVNCESINKCIQKYNAKLGECQKYYNNGLCMNLINFKYEYDDHKLKAKSCVNKMEDLEPIKSDLAARVLLPFVTMTLISFILIFLYKFTSFGAWIRPKLGGKNKTNKLDKRIQELHNTSELGGRRYKLPYHSSYS